MHKYKKKADPNMAFPVWIGIIISCSRESYKNICSHFY